MKLLKKGFIFYINSSIHVGLAVTALSMVTVLEYDLSIPPEVYYFIFFGTITAYNFVKYAKIAGLHHRSLTNSLKSIQIFSVFCFGMMIFFAFRISINAVLVTFGFGLLTFFYAVPFLKRKNLRTISGIKIFIVGIVWAGITVMVPMMEVKLELTNDCWLTFFQRVLLVIALTIPFEIRDIPYDAPNLKTLPQQMGVRAVKIVGVVILGAMLLLELCKDILTPNHFVSLFLMSFLVAGVLIFTGIKQSKFYASFWVEGIPILWFLSLFYLENGI